MSDENTRLNVGAMSGAHVQIAGVTKVYNRNDGNSTRALSDVSLELAAGEFVVLLGPSGCGKTTLLRSVAGTERPDSGSISIGSKLVFDSESKVFLPPESRDASMVFQSYALWPHLSVIDNVGFPLRASGASKKDSRTRAAEMLGQMQLGQLGGQYPTQLSGGQQQRVALARALVSGSELILFDEPLSNVDAKVREALRIQIAQVQSDVGFAALYVTHDQSEALQLADRVVVMSQGEILQTGSPEDVYRSPANRYVGNFVGSANFFKATESAAYAGTGYAVSTSVGKVYVASPTREFDDAVTGESLPLVFFRPEHCEISSKPPSGKVNSWEGRVEVALFSGPHIQYVIALGDERVTVWSSRVDHEWQPGDEVWVTVSPDLVRIMKAEVSA